MVPDLTIKHHFVYSLTAAALVYCSEGILLLFFRCVLIRVLCVIQSANAEIVVAL